MEQTLRQLGELLLGAIPTIVLFLILLGSYRLILHNSLENTLMLRRERTEGAMAKARADISAAEAKTTEYENALRDARLTPRPSRVKNSRGRRREGTKRWTRRDGGGSGRYASH